MWCYEDNNSSSDSDEEDDGDAKPEMLRGEGLASLIASYDSDSSEDEEGEGEKGSCYNHSFFVLVFFLLKSSISPIARNVRDSDLDLSCNI